MSKHEALGGKVLTKPFLFFSAVAAVGLVLLGWRFVSGLGAVANMNQGYPWGIWVIYDVMIGTAFACGGYALALLVYILNKGEYHPLVRPALLASVLGYSLGAFGAMFDMGRYWQAFNIFLPWHMNFNSVMLEVGLCVSAYTGVLWIEFAPTAMERFRAPEKLRALLNKVLFGIIALGVLLPTMHQSSLGSLLIVAGHKVSPLWQTDLVPLLFLVSAIAMGFSIVMFEASLSALGFRRLLETPLLAKLSRIVAGILVFYLVVRFADLVLRGQLGLAFAGDLQGNMFWVETLLYAAPVVLLGMPRYRASLALLFAAAVSLLLAGALYRFNAFLIGFDPGPGFHYFPSVPEILVSLGLIAIEIAVYIYVVKRLPVLHRLETA